MYIFIYIYTYVHIDIYVYIYQPRQTDRLSRKHRLTDRQTV